LTNNVIGFEQEGNKYSVCHDFIEKERKIKNFMDSSGRICGEISENGIIHFYPNEETDEEDDEKDEDYIYETDYDDDEEEEDDPKDEDYVYESDYDDDEERKEPEEDPELEKAKLEFQKAKERKHEVQMQIWKLKKDLFTENQIMVCWDLEISKLSKNKKKSH
jgi:hypothetical protein